MPLAGGEVCTSLRVTTQCAHLEAIGRTRCTQWLRFLCAFEEQAPVRSASRLALREPRYRTETCGPISLNDNNNNKTIDSIGPFEPQTPLSNPRSSCPYLTSPSRRPRGIIPKLKQKNTRTQGKGGPGLCPDPPPTAPTTRGGLTTQETSSPPPSLLPCLRR